MDWNYCSVQSTSGFNRKLIGAEDIPSEVDIQVGTIHGFQGDECDIIFAVFNTPHQLPLARICS